MHAADDASNKIMVQFEVIQIFFQTTNNPTII